MKNDLTRQMLCAVCFVFGIACVGLSVYYSIDRFTSDWLLISIAQDVFAILFFYSYYIMKKY